MPVFDDSADGAGFVVAVALAVVFAASACGDGAVIVRWLPE